MAHGEQSLAVVQSYSELFVVVIFQFDFFSSPRLSKGGLYHDKFLDRSHVRFSLKIAYQKYNPTTGLASVETITASGQSSRLELGWHT